MSIVVIIIAVVAILALWMIGGYNGFIKQKNLVEEAFATMDVYLKKRYDIIPNLVNTVKGYAKHEKETLENVVSARNAAVKATTPSERAAGEGAIESALGRLFALAENYPDLKANAQFLDLQSQLSSMEGEIAQSRKYYNAVVKIFNTRCEIFPSSILAAIFGFKRYDMFEVDSEQERQNVRVNFDD